MTKLNKTKREVLLLLYPRYQTLTQTEIIKKLGKSRFGTYKVLKSLSDNKFILVKRLSNINNYCLTNKGIKVCKQVLGQSDEPHVPLVRAHGLLFKIPIVRKPSGNKWNFPRNYFSDLDTEVKMTHWENQVTGRFHGYWFQVTPSSINLRLKDIYGTFPTECIMESLEIVSTFLRVMSEVNEGLVLGKTTGGYIEMSSQEFAIENDQFATIATKLSGGNPQIIRPKFLIDFSKGAPEIDFTDNLTAGDDSEKYADFVMDVINERILPKDLTHENLGNVGTNLEKMSGYMGVLTDKQGELMNQFGHMMTGNVSAMQHNQRISQDMLKHSGDVLKYFKELRAELDDMKMRMSWTWKVKRVVNWIKGR